MKTFSRLQAEISTQVSNFPGQIGLVIKELASGRSILFNEDQRFVAASIIKLPILWELFRQSEAGALSLSARVSLREAQKVGGTGILYELCAGLQPTIGDLATLMIILSDNTATNLLIEMLGFAEINQTISQLGLNSSSLQRQMMDTERAKQGYENYVTAADVARLLEQIWQSEALSSASRSAMLDILKRQQLNDLLPADLPQGTPFAHKTGQLPGIEHDAGILLLEPATLIIVALTRQPGENLAGPAFCRSVGRLVYEQYSADKFENAM
jgi:beta-lactamase class A